MALFLSFLSAKIQLIKSYLSKTWVLHVYHLISTDDWYYALTIICVVCCSQIAKAVGPAGPNYEYLFRLEEALGEIGKVLSWPLVRSIFFLNLSHEM